MRLRDCELFGERVFVVVFVVVVVFFFFFFFKQKTAYEIGTGDWSSDVCSSDLQKCNSNCNKRKNEFLMVCYAYNLG